MNKAYYDQDFEYRNLPANGENSLEKQAQTVVGLKEFFGGSWDTTLFTSEYDPTASKIAAVCQADRMIALNGNRMEKVSQFLGEQVREAHHNSPWTSLVVSRDPNLASYLEELSRYCVVYAFVPGKSIPVEYIEAATRAKQQGRQIECRILDMPQNSVYKPQVYVATDFENVIGCLKDLDISLDTLYLHEQMKKIAQQFGEVAQECYAADWSKLPVDDAAKTLQTLVEQGVKPLHTQARAGKNSLDLVLNNEVNVVLSHTRMDVLICFTNDKDFRDLFQRVRSRGVKVIAGGIRGMLTRDLIDAADDVVYLDDFIPEMKEQTPPEVLDAGDPMSELVMQIAVTQYKRGWRYITARNLFSMFGNTPQRRQRLEEALRAGYLTGPDEQSAFRLNQDNRLVRAAFRLLKFLSTRIHHVKEVQGKKHVTIGFLVRGMLRERPLADIGIAVNAWNAGAWIDLAAAAGLLIICLEDDPDRPGLQITTCHLM
jgi:uncharacterized LabA/DUF88 family protein